MIARLQSWRETSANIRMTQDVGSSFFYHPPPPIHHFRHLCQRANPSSNLITGARTSQYFSVMSPAVREPQQYKQSSRKGKKAWRKNVDITPIQQGLESLREEIRQGGPIAEKASEDLFVVDVAGSEDIKKKHKLPKPLKVDQILAERSAVPAVDGRKRTQSKLGDGIYEPSSKRQRKDWVSKKEVQRLKQNINKQSHLDNKQADDDVGAGFDLWNQTPAEPTTTTSQDEYIPKPKPKVAPQSIRQPPTALTAIGKPIKAVTAPDAGKSYNPSLRRLGQPLRPRRRKRGLSRASTTTSRASRSRERRSACCHCRSG